MRLPVSVIHAYIYPIFYGWNILPVYLHGRRIQPLLASSLAFSFPLYHLIIVYQLIQSTLTFTISPVFFSPPFPSILATILH